MLFIFRKVSSVARNLNNERLQNGFRGLFSYAWKRFKYYFFSVINFAFTLPFALLIIAIRPYKEIYLVMLLSSRIGHFSANPEFMLLSRLDAFCDRKKRYLFYEETMVCNIQLSKMWKRVLPVLPFPYFCHELDKTLWFLLGKKYKNDPIKEFESCKLGRDHQKLLEKRSASFLYFTPREVYAAEKILAKMGVKKIQPFVCILVRDAGYLDHRAPGKHLFRHHDCRNADINNYDKAALFLAEKGYVVFRMGKHVEKPFYVDHPNIIDYANHPLRCDLLDMYLPAHCDFIISTSTGLDCVSQLFKKPLLFTDLFPIFCQLQFWYPCTLFIPKKICYRDTKKILNFRELEQEFLNITDLTIQNRMERQNTEIVPNTPDEILDAVIEMEARVKNTWQDTEENIRLQKILLQKCFPATIFVEEVRESLEKIKINIGSKFILENIALLGID